MSFVSILYTVLISPLQLFFEVIYTITNRYIRNPGLSIIVLSLIMNFLVLPLYNRADAMQEEEREIEARLQAGISHIKKTFRGDERMMILQTYYRQNHYKPTYALRGSISLLLEVPFFIAAYHFLSQLQVLHGASLGIISDLGSPDALLHIAGVSINVLPFVMTSVNLISCFIFTKGYPKKTKIQLFAMALFFLVFLYSSPSGLVFYWTLNNLFSLVKTIVYKMKIPFFERISTKLSTKLVTEQTDNPRIFYSGAIFLSILLGMLIPSAVLSSSPQEFVDIQNMYHPIWYMVSAFCLAFGFCMVWLNVFYKLANTFYRIVFEKLVWIFCGVAVVNYFFFGTRLGVLFSSLKYEKGLNFTGKEKLFNLLIICVVAIVLYVVFVKCKKVVVPVLMTGILAMTGMVAINVFGINTEVNKMKAQNQLYADAMPQFSLSKSGQNVVVLVLDRAMNVYVPYMFEEKPELKEQFAGFTYYDNVVSFGGYTNFGMPAVFGGYEYTPMEMNKRDTELLVDKHNEALKVMPVLFHENQYKVTVCDPTYANYQWIPDTSIYDEYPEIETYVTYGRFGDTESKESDIRNRNRNFFCYSVVKVAPLCIQGILYDSGEYNQSNAGSQTVIGTSVANGLSSEFMEPYNVLTNLSNMTQIEESQENTFLMMANDTTHNPMLLQEGEYVPAQHVDNTEYDEKNKDRFVVDGKELKMEDESQFIHYQSNMAAMLQLGKWFDYLRANDVYDNTRIIIVSDHGKPLGHREDLLFAGESGDTLDMEYFYPLLMVKDFGADEFTTSSEFMTNGDVPTLATKEIIPNPVNPFTGKQINNDEKTLHDQYIIKSEKYQTSENNGYQYLPGDWYTISDDMKDMSNWTCVGRDTILQ